MKVIFLVLSILFCLSAAASPNPSTSPKRILIISTSHSEVPNSDKKTGVWLTELTEPYVEFRKAGFVVDIASPKGGTPPIDPRSGDVAKLEKEFKDYPEGIAAFKNTLKLSEVKVTEYMALFLAGGHGTMWDFNTDLVGNVVGSFYQSGKVVGSVCHGPAGLLKAKNAKGESILKGKTVTAFTNKEEFLAGWSQKELPFSLEDEMKKLGVKFDNALPFLSKVQTSGLLVTGQNPASADKTAQAVVKLLNPKTSQKP